MASSDRGEAKMPEISPTDRNFVFILRQYFPLSDSFRITVYFSTIVGVREIQNYFILLF